MCYGDTCCCKRCYLFPHKSCAEYPTEIQLSLHQDHPLKLQTGTSKFRERCDLCNYICRGLTFRCEVCNFKIDFTCARMLIDFRKNDNYYIKHYSHCHDLSINKKKMNDDACSYACNKHVSVEGYSCSKCGFYLHKSRSLDLIEHYGDYKHIKTPSTTIHLKSFTIKIKSLVLFIAMYAANIALGLPTFASCASTTCMSTV